MNMQKKWLITGAAGFIGSHIADFLLSQGQQVIGLDNFFTGTTENVQRLQAAHTKNWECLFVDIRDQTSLMKIVDFHRPDYVVHLAAQVSVQQSIANPQATQAINVDGFLNVLLAAKAFAVQRFIYMSSSAVYGEQTTLPIKETAALKPLSFYGLTKQINEKYAELLADEDFICIGLRLFNIFGPYQRADSPYSGVIAKWFNQIQAGKPLTIYGDGSATRDYCFVTNVAKAIPALAKASLPQKHVVYNIGSGQATSLQQLSQRLTALAGKLTVPVEYAANRVGDILHSVADIQAAQHDFDYQSSILLNEGLQIMLQAHPAKF